MGGFMALTIYSHSLVLEIIVTQFMFLRSGKWG